MYLQRSIAVGSADFSVRRALFQTTVATVKFMYLCRHGTLDEKLILLFQFYDRDGNGSITREEMMNTYVSKVD